MQVMDNLKNPVIYLNRSVSCIPIIGTMEVSAMPDGNLYGHIIEEWTFCSVRFTIKNHNGEIVFSIERNGASNFKVNSIHCGLADFGFIDGVFVKKIRLTMQKKI